MNIIYNTVIIYMQWYWKIINILLTVWLIVRAAVFDQQRTQEELRIDRATSAGFYILICVAFLFFILYFTTRLFRYLHVCKYRSRNFRL